MSVEKTKKLYTCELCGKTDSEVDAWVGGYLTYGHHECAEIANKGLKLFLRFLIADINGLEILAKEIVGVAEQMRKR